MDSIIGKVLDGRYEIIEVIGTGGMAIVYKAQDLKLNRMVAVKLLKPELRGDMDLRRRFHAESEAVARLNHPNIINVFDVSASDAAEYFVMELIDGITLKQYMTQRGVLSVKEALHFTLQILKGLEHAHAKKIVHRDIKPQNIMILRDGTAKVTDFGIARIFDSKDMTTNQANAFGSVHYIAPEQARCGETDGRADLYSVGVMLYEMLTGQLPYQGDTAVVVAMQHIRSAPRPPREINPDIPEALQAITLHAMSASLDTRYATASEMMDDLEAYRQDPEHFMPTFARQVYDDDGDTKRFTPVSEPTTEPPVKPQPNRTAPATAEPEKRKPINLMPIVAAVLSVLVVAAVVAAIWINILSPETGSREVPVPKLIGRTYLDVSGDSTLSFELVVREEKYDSTYEEGVIIDQNQPVGKIVKEGSTIELTLSKGKRSAEMPNYINWSYTEANNDLRALMEKTVSVVYDFEPSDTVQANKIIRTDPIAGQTITEGQVIRFVISQGTESDTLPMPNLLGQTEEQARSTLLGVGLNVGTVEYSISEDYPAGCVIDQSVQPDVPVPRGMTINLVLSRAPETTPPAIDEPTTPPESSTTTDSSPDTSSTGTTPPAVERSVDWTLLLPQGVDYPDQFLLEIYVDNVIQYSETVEKTTGSITLRLYGTGTVRVDAYIDTSLYKSETISIS